MEYPTQLICTETILSSGVSLKDYLHTVERQLVFAALQKSGGNKTQAANLLGLKRSTLLMKMKVWEANGRQTSSQS